ncbi:MAG: Ig-like domain-containing protein [Sandaracinus sp.]|nr:Ig-like domain-containing protein [Sandaracinus sp.]MCB9612561.1 Ig-like domain-containing protein [Sandaracinus sp.]
MSGSFGIAHGGRRRRAALVAIALLLGCDHGGLVLDGATRALGSSPADGSLDVPRRLELRVFFDRPLAPRSVSRASVSLRSGPQQRFLSVRYDPVDRALVTRDFTGAALEPNVEYELRVEGVRDLDGGSVAPFVARFFTGATLGEPPPIPSAGWAEVEPIFAARCVDAECHGGDRPALGLDLGSAEGVRATAIGVPAVSDSLGGLSERGLSGFPRIDVIAGVGRPDSSRLLYEVLRDPRVGEPMPPDDALTAEEVATIAHWILAGAPTE